MMELCEIEAPCTSPARSGSSLQSWGPALPGLRGMAGPEPGVSSGLPRSLLTLASPESLQPGLSQSQPQQGVGPELLKEGQGQSQVQAVGEQGRKQIPPTHSEPPVGTQRQRTLLAGLPWKLKLPGCWGAGNFIWNLVSQTAESQGFWCPAGGQLGQDPSEDPGPCHWGFVITILNNNI